MTPLKTNLRVKVTLPPAGRYWVEGETPSKTELGGPPEL